MTYVHRDFYLTRQLQAVTTSESIILRFELLRSCFVYSISSSRAITDVRWQLRRVHGASVHISGYGELWKSRVYCRTAQSTAQTGEHHTMHPRNEIKNIKSSSVLLLNREEINLIPIELMAILAMK